MVGARKAAGTPRDSWGYYAPVYDPDTDPWHEDEENDPPPPQQHPTQATCMGNAQTQPISTHRLRCGRGPSQQHSHSRDTAADPTLASSTTTGAPSPAANAKPQRSRPNSSRIPTPSRHNRPARGNHAQHRNRWGRTLHVTQQQAEQPVQASTAANRPGQPAGGHEPAPAMGRAS